MKNKLLSKIFSLKNHFKRTQASPPSEYFRFNFKCPRCKTNLLVPISWIGEKKICDSCSSPIDIIPVGRFFDGLNLSQQTAVATVDGVIRVTAGAGTGKTKVLTNRLMRLIEDIGILPDNILSVTFTNKAAGEMKRRVRERLGNNISSRISTFHGFCHELLKEDIHCINFPRTFFILDEDDQKQILKEIYEDLGLSGSTKTYKDAMRSIRELKCDTPYIDFLSNTDARQNFFIPENEETSTETKIFNRYLFKQRKLFSLDYDDLILMTIYILSKFNDLREKWNKRIQYIQVDEFQDVSTRQWTLLLLLAGKSRNLFVVGDPDQTIYSWRGANVNIFLHDLPTFAKAPEAHFKDIVLEDNYRSTQSILDVSNGIIKNNTERIRKNLKSATHKKGVKPLFFHGETVLGEVKWLSDQIEAIAKSPGKSYGDIAILVRSLFITRELEMGLMQRKIPYRVINGMRFYERKEVKDALAYLHLIAFGDDLSFRRIINTPSRGIGKSRINFLENFAVENQISLYDALKANINHPLFTISFKDKANTITPQQFVNLIDKMRESNATASEILDDVLALSGYRGSVLASGDEDGKENLVSLQEYIVQQEKQEDQVISIAECLNRIALYAETEPDESDFVRIMTIHTAKGLEFPFVFLPHFNEGILPSRKARQKGEIEEERRIAYVALTRAEKVLFLSDSAGNSREQNSLPSRFLLEIEQELLQIDKTVPPSFWQESKEKVSDHINKTASMYDQNFFIGQNVMHEFFGYGEIKGIAGDAITVLFDNGEKTLSAHSLVTEPSLSENHDEESKLRSEAPNSSSQD